MSHMLQRWRGWQNRQPWLAVTLAVMGGLWGWQRGGLARPLLWSSAGYFLLLGLSGWARAGARLRIWRRHHALPSLPGWGAWVAMVAVSGLVMPVFLTAKLPAGWDWPMHAWKAHSLARLLPALRGYLPGYLLGWEHDDYPLLGYLPAALLHLLSGKTIPVDNALALQGLLVLMAWPMAFWAWLRRESGPWLALAGAVAVMLDPGAMDVGGLVSYGYAGLFPFRQMSALVILALGCADGFVQTGRRALLGWAMVGVALASSTHLAGWLLSALGVLCLTTARFSWVHWQRWVRVALGTGAAAITCAWFALPFQAQMDRYTRMTVTGYDLAGGLWQALQNLNGMYRRSALEMSILVVATVWLALRGHIMARFAIASVILGPFLLSKDLAQAWAPDFLRPALAALNYDRFAVFARGALAACAGMAICITLATFFRHFWGRRVMNWRVHGTAASLLAAVAVALSATAGLQDFLLWRIRSLPAARDLPDNQAGLEAVRWWAEHAPEDAALVIDHRCPLKPDAIATPCAHLDGLAELTTDRTIMPAKEVAAQGYRFYGTHVPDFSAEEVLAGGATHWASWRGPPAPGFQTIQTFPSGWSIHEAPRVLPDMRVNSNKPVTLSAWTQDETRVTGPSDGWQATLRVRWSPRMYAETPGAQLSASPFLPGSPPIFTHLEVPAGITEVVIRYGSPPRAGLGWLLTTLALMVCAGVLFGITPLKALASRVQRPQ